MKFLSVVTFFCAFTFSLFADSNDYPNRWNPIYKMCKESFQTKKFEKLDDMAAHYRESNLLMDNGYNCLRNFYYCFDHPISRSGRTDEEWVYHLDCLGEWMGQTGSVTSGLAYANALVSYAWAARGKGYAKTVTDGGWDLFYKRLDQAKAFMNVHSDYQDCPDYYYVLQRIALGQAMPKDEYYNLVNKAYSHYHNYDPYYFQAVTFLLPRWYGEKGEWVQFINDIFEKLPEDKRYIMYASLVQDNYDRELVRLGNLEKAGISWEIVERGFEELLKQINNNAERYSWYLYMACKEGQRGLAKELFLRKTGYSIRWNDMFRRDGMSYRKWVEWSGLEFKDVVFRPE